MPLSKTLRAPTWTNYLSAYYARERLVTAGGYTCAATLLALDLIAGGPARASVLTCALSHGPRAHPARDSIFFLAHYMGFSGMSSLGFYVEILQPSFGLRDCNTWNAEQVLNLHVRSTYGTVSDLRPIFYGSWIIDYPISYVRALLIILHIQPSI